VKVLLDECVTRKLKREFIGHDVSTVDEAGMKGLKNGNLLRSASGRFDVLVTVDRSLPDQQNIKSYNIAVLVLAARKNSYDALNPLIPRSSQKYKCG
jgi:hypothetical protein